MVDLIIPAYNAHKTIGYTIASVVNQLDHSEVKITIVDDCSENNYAEIVKRFDGLVSIREIRMPENGGPGLARQFGIDNTTEPYLMFMDADDILVNVATIRKLKAPLDKDKNVYLVSAGFYEENENDIILEHTQDLVWTFGKMYRRSYLQEYNIRFNSTRANEDTGFHTKMRAVAKETDLVWFIPDFVYMWRHQPNSITRENNFEYGHNKGFIGYIDNKIEALTFPNVHPQFTREHSMSVLTECYRSYINTSTHRSEFTDVVRNYSRKFWNECAKKIYYEDVDWARKEIYKTFVQSAPQALPLITFDQFLEVVESE